MTRYSSYLLLLAGTCIFSVSCTSVPDTALSQPQVNFASFRATPIHVRAVETRMEGRRTEGNFVVDPLAALQRYLDARFSPHGSRDILNVIVEDASVTKVQQESDVKIARMLNVGGMDVYHITLRLRLEHVSDSGQTLYGKVLTARRVMYISEHASIADREREEIKGLETLFRDLDREVEHLVTEDMRLGRHFFH